MIICRTPYRVSFFGGGTDYPVWYRENGGMVLATTIDKYCYVTCRYLPPFFEHKHRIVWSKIENVKKISEIEHPVVRVALDFLRIKDGVEIHHVGDLPAKSGLGASSSFAVGLLHALYHLRGDRPTKKQLAEEAIYLEREVLKEKVGSQDQVLTAFGGLSKVIFDKKGKFRVQPLNLSTERRDDLQNHLMMVFTGLTRLTSDITRHQIINTPNKKRELTMMGRLVNEGSTILSGKGNLQEFGKLLHESWKLKRSLSDKISNNYIDQIYETALKNGAIGGKLLGAGGGGFLLLYANPDDQKRIKNKLKNLKPKDIDVVILCGGKGERLRPILANNPKPMADIDNRPFLDLLINYTATFGFLRFILCTGYLGDQIEEYYSQRSDKRIAISREETPLGTGGAIKNASTLIESNPFTVMNGDSYCPINFQDFVNDYSRKKARHEIVLTNPDDRKDIDLIELNSRREVTSLTGTLSNAGIYLFDKNILNVIPNRHCSLEHDILPNLIGKDFYGYLTDAPCFDIGTPARYLQFLQNRAGIGI